MSKRYRKFGKAEFEWNMRELKSSLGFRDFLEVTDDLIRNGYKINERVYLLRTANPSVNILIYSSIDKSNEKVRDIGNDAVRLVLVWNTKKGRYFRKLHKHLRIETIFKNMEKSLKEGKSEAESMKLKIWEFSEGIGLDYK